MQPDRKVFLLNDIGDLVGEKRLPAGTDPDQVFTETPYPGWLIGKFARFVESEWVEIAPEEYTPGEIAPYESVTELSSLKRYVLADINAACDAAISVLKAGYPTTEVETWTKQEAEAIAWDADPAAYVPLLTGIATARGIDLGDLVGRVLANSDAWTLTISALIGKRQALEDQLLAIDLEEATARDQLLAIRWD